MVNKTVIYKGKTYKCVCTNCEREWYELNDQAEACPDCNCTSIERKEIKKQVVFAIKE